MFFFGGGRFNETPRIDSWMFWCPNRFLKFLENSLSNIEPLCLDRKLPMDFHKNVAAYRSLQLPLGPPEVGWQKDL